MPNKTEFLALNQWEGSDAVLHTDFNEDNQKVEQAVQALHQLSDTTAARLHALAEKEAVDYEFLSFALLNALTLTSLESYYPGDKQGLIYDSFVGNGKAGALPNGTHIMQAGRYLGMGTAIDETELQAALPTTSTHTAFNGGEWRHFFRQNSCGYLKGFSVNCDFGASATLTIKIRRANAALTVAGEEISSQTMSRAFANSLSIQAITFHPVYLTPGDYVIEMIPTKNVTISKPMHTFVYDSCAGNSAVFTSIAFPFSNFRDGQVKARVTHDVGTVGVTLIGAGGERFPMSVCGAEAGTSQDGEACLVSEYALDDSAGLDGSVKVELLMSSPQTKGMRVFDYGVVFL